MEIKIRGNDLISFVKSAFPVLAGVAALVIVGYLGIHYTCRYRAVIAAERYLSKGFGMLAQEVIEPYRRELASTERGCKVMLATSFQTQDPRTIDYAVQSCLKHNKDLPEVYLAYAASRELQSKDNDAAQVLSQALKKFSRNAEIPVKLGQIFQRHKQDKDAVAAYSIASERAPQDYDLALNVLQYAMKLNSRDEMRATARRLSAAPTDNPEIKLLIAEAFTQLGDHPDAQEALNRAKEMMSRNPKNKGDLEKKYAKLFAPQGMPSIGSIPNTPSTTPGK